MILQTVIYFIVFPLLSATLVLGFIRLLLGPTLPDRIIAFELISITSAGIIVVSAIVTDQAVLVDDFLDLALPFPFPEEPLPFAEA